MTLSAFTNVNLFHLKKKNAILKASIRTCGGCELRDRLVTSSGVKVQVTNETPTLPESTICGWPVYYVTNPNTVSRWIPTEKQGDYSIARMLWAMTMPTDGPSAGGH